MVVNSAGLQPESDSSGNPKNNCTSKLQTHPLVREGASHKATRNRQTERNLVTSYRLEPDTKTDWPTDRRS
jgi:hypothetical protein